MLFYIYVCFNLNHGTNSKLCISSAVYKKPNPVRLFVDQLNLKNTHFPSSVHYIQVVYGLSEETVGYCSQSKKKP